MSFRSPAVFLDKDGTLIEDVPYNVDPARMRFAAGAAAALPLLRDAGYRLVVVSNQSGVARGLFDEPALAAVEQALRGMMKAAGVDLEGFYYCPHHPQAAIARYRVACACRKPMPGLLLRAASELGIDLAESWMIGDILDDVEAGHAAGCRAVLVANGNETEWRVTRERWPDSVATDMTHAAKSILAAGREVVCG